MIDEAYSFIVEAIVETIKLRQSKIYVKKPEHVPFCDRMDPRDNYPCCDDSDSEGMDYDDGEMRMVKVPGYENENFCDDLMAARNFVYEKTWNEMVIVTSVIKCMILKCP